MFYLTQQHSLHVCMPYPGYRPTFNRPPDFVVQDDRVYTLSALHATKDLVMVLIAVQHVVVPFGHQQACATSAGLSSQLPADARRPHAICASIFLFHSPPPVLLGFINTLNLLHGHCPVILGITPVLFRSMLGHRYDGWASVQLFLNLHISVGLLGRLAVAES